MGWRVWVIFAFFGIQDLRSTTAIVTVAGCGARNWTLSCAEFFQSVQNYELCRINDASEGRYAWLSI